MTTNGSRFNRTVLSFSFTCVLLLFWSGHLEAQHAQTQECREPFIDYIERGERSLSLPILCRSYLAIVIRQSMSIPRTEGRLAFFEKIDSNFQLRGIALNHLDLGEKQKAIEILQIISGPTQQDISVATMLITSLDRASIRGCDLKTPLATCIKATDISQDDLLRWTDGLGLESGEVGASCLARLKLPEISIDEIIKSTKFGECTNLLGG